MPVSRLAKAAGPSSPGTPRNSRAFTWGWGSTQERSTRPLVFSTTATFSKWAHRASSSASSSGARVKSFSKWRSHSSPPERRPSTHRAVSVWAAASSSSSWGMAGSWGLGLYLPKSSYIKPLLTASFSWGSSMAGALVAFSCSTHCL